MKILITCEHASLAIPAEYQYLFADEKAQQILATHEGYDIGAREISELLQSMASYSILGEYSRLLIDYNRSLHHEKLFSEYTKKLNLSEKQSIINQYYLPYRAQVESEIINWLKLGVEVRHFSIHSFSPVLNNAMRTTDIGLLYDPSRMTERDLAKTLKPLIQELKPSWRIRSNYPYLGKADGFVTYLRRRFPLNYIGMEIEINQHLLSLENYESIADVLAKVLFR